MIKLIKVALSVIICILFCQCTTTKRAAIQKTDAWESIFNGTDIDDWTTKIYHYETGDNFGETFRVEDSIIKIRYDQYGNHFNDRFGHLYYNKPYSYFHLKLEYRIVGDVCPGTPGYAYKNSGIMYHSQDPRSMLKEQDWPISVEMQLLAGLTKNKERSTGNMCSPGTDIEYNGKIDPRHCINSSSKTYYGDQWVSAELIVMGDSIVKHIINGEQVMQYSKPQIGGGTANGFDPKIKIDGTSLTQGFIALQSEGQPIDFKNIKIKNLKGCMNPKAKNYRDYYIKNDEESCEF